MPYKPPSLFTRFKWWLEGKYFYKRRRVKRRKLKWPPRMPKYARVWGIIIFCTAGAAYSYYLEEGGFTSTAEQITCRSPYIIDGDTFDCGGTRIRLAGIDTPEMPGHCRRGRDCTAGDPYAARDFLQRLTRMSVTCKQTDIDHYGRVIGRCEAGGKDLSCELLDSGHAVRRYGFILCL